MSHPEQAKGTQAMRCKYAAVDGKTIFYREGGPANAPTILCAAQFPELPAHVSRPHSGFDREVPRGRA